MSCVICLRCDRLLDVKEDLDGTWTDAGQYICTDCTEMEQAYKEAVRMEEEKWDTGNVANLKRS
jgi:hypothetical protein